MAKKEKQLETRPIMWYDKSLENMTKEELEEWVNGLDIDGENREELRKWLGLVEDVIKEKTEGENSI